MMLCYILGIQDSPDMILDTKRKSLGSGFVVNTLTMTFQPVL